MAGRGHTEPISGNGEIDGGLGGTGVGDAVVAENVHGHIVIGTHGVGATADHAAKDLLQHFPVLGDLVVGDGTGNAISKCPTLRRTRFSPSLRMLWVRPSRSSPHGIQGKLRGRASSTAMP